MSEEKNNFINLTERRVTHSFGFWFAIGVVFVLLEQLTKFFAAQNHWPIFNNQNFAFSIPLPVAVMYTVYFIVLLFVVRTIMKQWRDLSLLTKLGWTLVLAGGISNIAERIALGYVRDFIRIATGVFNAADFFIISGLLIVIFTYQKETLS